MTLRPGGRRRILTCVHMQGTYDRLQEMLDSTPLHLLQLKPGHAWLQLTTWNEMDLVELAAVDTVPVVI